MTDNQSNKQNTIGNQSKSIVRSDEGNLAEKPRSARIAVYNDMQLGVCIYLTVLDLRKLGINLNQIDSDVVEYTIDDETSRLTIRPLNR